GSRGPPLLLQPSEGLVNLRLRALVEVLCVGHLAHRHLHPFPTRRSSDLPLPRRLRRGGPGGARADDGVTSCGRGGALLLDGPPRSEEHTSELQSRENLVCRLLLEKKKQQLALAFGTHARHDIAALALRLH